MSEHIVAGTDVSARELARSPRQSWSWARVPSDASGRPRACVSTNEDRALGWTPRAGARGITRAANCG